MNNKDNNTKEEPNVSLFNFSMNSSDSTPVFKEGKALWIPYGDDNLYGTHLINLMNSSSKHNSLLRKKTNMATGNGFIKTPENTAFLENEHGVDDMDSIAFKNAYDLMGYGGFAYAITWDKGKKTIARKTYIDFKKVRLAKELDDDSEMARRQAEGVPFYYISADWSNTRKAKNKPQLIQGFSEKYKDESTQLVWDMEYRPGNDFYSLPDYISSISWIELDREISTFHLASVQNGFTPSMIISFKGGEPSREEIKKLKKQLNSEYGGSENASRAFVTFTAPGVEAPDFIPIEPNSSDERFLQLEQQIQQNIIIAHGANPQVAGIATAGKLGSSSEILEAELMFQKNVIETKQNILENSYNKIASINNVPELKLKYFNSVEELKKDTE